jgi:23S rRNA 5-hydroxycytidine C2501 synthase
MNETELLSPARDLETGFAAINCGADAVYMGAPQFGAREAAGNSLADIENMAAYAHRYWARVYVTVNTLLFDEELAQAEKMIHQLYQCGADAVIIQDVGLLECSLPPIPLFASTQMHNHTPERVRFLEQVGFQRVILARELSLDEIKTIRSQTHLELETFIHGALCVSYSGQCYASYALGGRSGNRGQCAQPCRRKYSLVDEQGQVLQKGRHLLSLKDLNLGSHLEDLLNAGVNSFKIEGRLKDKAYVMNVVSTYRRQLDQILNRGQFRAASSGKSQVNFNPDPVKTFNRGYTTYFLNNRDPNMASPDTPKSIGEPIGKVLAVHKTHFTLSTSIQLHSGDGICFLDRQGDLCGTVINQVNGQQVSPQKLDDLHPGTMIYRNYDHLFISTLNKAQVERKMNLTLNLEYVPGCLALTLMDEDGVTIREETAYTPQPARDALQAEENIRKQLLKLGGTSFSSDKVNINLPEPFFIPLSTLNLLRRNGIEKLIQARQNSYMRPQGHRVTNEVPFLTDTLDFTGNVLNQKAKQFYARHGVKSIAPAAESGLDMTGHKIMTTRYCIKYQMGICPRQKPVVPVSGNLTLVDEDGNQFPLKFDCSRCQMEVYFDSYSE